MKTYRTAFVLLTAIALAAALPGCGGGGSASYTLNITVENGPGCTVEPASGVSYPAGTTVTLTPSFATGYVLDHWGGTNGPEVTPEYTIVMDGDKHITAVFAKLQYDLDAVSADEAAGSVFVRIVPPDESFA